MKFGTGYIALGTDIAGSVRYPAYACGVHGAAHNDAGTINRRPTYVCVRSFGQDRRRLAARTGSVVRNQLLPPHRLEYKSLPAASAKIFASKSLRLSSSADISPVSSPIRQCLGIRRTRKPLIAPGQTVLYSLAVISYF